mmetsp:Transcript_27717/g.65112  ORF Transcript_27717/g.65112 Transcript_27717/m.65112 type:complete len:201 (-) Transcript_27717:1014-1616(-)
MVVRSAASSTRWMRLGSPPSPDRPRWICRAVDNPSMATFPWSRHLLHWTQFMIRSRSRVRMRASQRLFCDSTAWSWSFLGATSTAGSLRTGSDRNPLRRTADSSSMLPFSQSANSLPFALEAADRNSMYAKYRFSIAIGCSPLLLNRRSNSTFGSLQTSSSVKSSPASMRSCMPRVIWADTSECIPDTALLKSAFQWSSS